MLGLLGKAPLRKINCHFISREICHTGVIGGEKERDSPERGCLFGGQAFWGQVQIPVLTCTPLKGTPPSLS